MKDFRKINVWHKSYAFCLVVYKLTQSFPKEEMFGLSSQLRRAAVSVSANIAEGCGRHTDVEFARFLDISLGSINEVDCYLELAKDLKYIDEPRFKELLEDLIEMRKMLTVFAQTVRCNAHKH
jgi:four helix bundle protein